MVFSAPTQTELSKVAFFQNTPEQNCPNLYLAQVSPDNQTAMNAPRP